MPNINITEVDIELLKFSEFNPRYLSEKAEADLTASIKKYGLVDPVLANFHPDRKNVLIGGNQRIFVAKKLGYKTVPVVYLNLSLELEKELCLRLNANQGEWSYDLLKTFDVSLLLDVGFSDEDLQHVWSDTLEIEDDGFDVAKAVKEHKEPKSKTGELYKLGEHFILCGNSLDPENVGRLLGKNKIDLVLNDPPYNLGYSYDKGFSTKGKYGSKMTNDAKSETEYMEFIRQSIKNSLAFTKPDAHFTYWCDENFIWLFQELYKELGIKHQRVNFWVKNGFSPVPQVAFNKAVEVCIYGTTGKPYLNPKVTNLTEVMNKEIGSGNRLIDDILDEINLWLVKRLPTASYSHPTSKPPTLYEKLLRRCTKPGDHILDLFAGSGTSIIAAEQLKRRVFAVEQEPLFVDVIIDRFQELTGKEAILCK